MRPGREGRSEQGQASVELALVLPLVALLALVLVQVGLIVRDQVLVTHAAREGARQAAVDGDPAAIRRAAASGSDLSPEGLRVEVGPRGGPGERVEVVVRYRSEVRVPLLGGLGAAVELSDRATMRVER
jgi:hypothetical protein